MDEKFFVTISHQLGCGGSYIGEKLSGELSVPFVDRQILKRVSYYLNVPEKHLEEREEKISSFWKSFANMELFNKHMPALEYRLSNEELFRLESEFISEIAGKTSAVFLGRGARYILRDYKRCFMVFVHASMDDRVKRVSNLYKVDKDEARKIIETNDKEREAYLRKFTKIGWLDAKTYDMCIDTTTVGLDNAVKMVEDGLKYKLDRLNARI